MEALAVLLTLDNLASCSDDGSVAARDSCFAACSAMLDGSALSAAPAATDGLASKSPVAVAGSGDSLPLTTAVWWDDSEA